MATPARLLNLWLELVCESVGQLSVERGVIRVLILGLGEGTRLVFVEGLGEGLRVCEAERLSVVEIVDSRDGRGLLLLLVQVLVEVGDLDAKIVPVGICNLDVVLVRSGRESETLATTGVSLTTKGKVVVLVCVCGFGRSEIGVLVGVVVGVVDGVVVGVVWVVVCVSLVVVLWVLAVVVVFGLDAVVWLLLLVVVLGMSVAGAGGVRLGQSAHLFFRGGIKEGRERTHLGAAVAKATKEAKKRAV